MVAAYLRVSTRGQDAAYQRAAIERAAHARGETVAVWYTDVASGSTMDRPELRSVFSMIRGKCVKRLWVWRWDRLTRSGIVDTLTMFREMKKHGCECSSVADGFSLDGPAAEVILSVLAWAAKMEREKIAENQSAARVRMAADGRSWGRPIVPISPEQIARVFELHRQGFAQVTIGAKVELSVGRVARILRENDPKAAAENQPLQNGESVRG